jgi:thioesterase domain-containing protein
MDWGGHIFEHLPWARCLSPDRPVYGLPAIGSEGEDPHQTVEEMAALYADQIRAFYPSGPYQLLGFSLGGWIAYAVADALIKRGGEISFLLLLDSEGDVKLDFWNTLNFHLGLHSEQAFLKKTGVIPLLNYGFAFAGRFLRKLSASRKREIATNHPDATISKASEPLSLETDYFVVACRRYKPKPLPVFVHLLIPSERKLWQIAFWNHYAQQGVKVHRIFDAHMDFINPEFAEPLAEMLKRMLA